MADNVTITPGSGASVAADDIGGILHQRVKISIGSDGVANDLAPGQLAKAASLPVVLASDDDIQGKLGIVTETVPASDTASSGLNGRLQRVAQRLTTLIDLHPTALGQGTMAQSQRVVLPSDQIVPVSSSGVISAVNSSSTPLGISGVFTGTAVNTLSYGSIVVSVFSSHASAANGLSIQQSSDGTNWDIVDTYTVSASASSKIVVPRQAAFARVVYTNAGTAQSTFRLQTILTPQMPGGSSVKASDALSIENDFVQGLSAQLVYNGTTLDLQRSVANSTNSTGTGIPAAGLMAQFDDVSPTAITENQFGNLRMSSDHILYTSLAATSAAGTALTTVATAAVAGSLVVKASAGNLYGFNVAAGASAGFVMLFNANSAPADGAVTPLKVYALAANATMEMAFTPPIRCSAGITLVFSTTGPFTKTISATAFISGDAV